MGAIILTIAYLLAYTHDPAMPGADASHSAGWYAWFDQGNYHKSTVALARNKLQSNRHWYPLGYALVGAPFARWMPNHCFLIPDLTCLLACFFGFITFSAASGVRRTFAVPVFLLSTFASNSLRHVWSQPWNTTLSAALIWWLLALSARTTRGTGGHARHLARMAGMGALCAAMIETRPGDIILVAVWAVVMSNSRLRAREALLASFAAAGTGGALLALPYAVLYLSIYGFHPTPYMRLSAGIGFSFAGLWWKAYLILIDPRPWLPDGPGLLQRFPWLLAGFAGLIATPFWRSEQRGPLAMLSLMICSSWGSIFLYNDFQPSGLWRFENVHYLKWAFPGLMLLGFILVRNLIGPQRLATFSICALVFLASAVRLEPKHASQHSPAWMVQVAQPRPPLFPTYFGSLILNAGPKRYLNTRDFRALPDEQGFRIVSFRRGFTGPLSLISHVGAIHDRAELPNRWRVSLRLSQPCWLPTFPCDRLR